MYDLALWKYYSVTVYSKLKSAYNKCITKLFGFTKRDSMTGIFYVFASTYCRHYCL